MTNLTAQDMAAAIRQIEAGSAYLPGLPAQVSIPVTALREAIAALVRWEAVPLYLNPPISLARLSYLYALLGAEQWIEAGQIWDNNPEEREAAYAEVRAALAALNGGRDNG